MTQANQYELYMLSLINAERAKVGADALQLELNLNESAEDHSRWMLQQDVFSHTGSGGSSATQRMDAAGFDFSGSWRSAENIAVQSERGAAGIMDDVLNLHVSLMNSAGHRANILNPALDYIGIGIELGNFQYSSGTYESVIVTQNFASTGGQVQLDNGQAPAVALTPVAASAPAATTNNADPFMIAGTSGNDVLNGTSADEHIRGGLGSDTLSGGNGDDWIEGGGHNDTLNAGNGNDSVSGGNGRDLAYMGDGDDIFYDKAQDGWDGSDTVYAGSGNDTIKGLGGNDTFFGDHGQDVIHGGKGNDVIKGGVGSDTLVGEDGNDFLEGGGHNDTLDAGNGNDSVSAGNGRDLAYMGDGNDIFYDKDQDGWDGSDTVYAGSGNDTIKGLGGDDVFFGGHGQDVIHGGNGNDRIDGGVNADILSGDAGSDTFVFKRGYDIDTIADFADNVDQIDLRSFNFGTPQNALSYAVQTGGDVWFDFGSGDRLIIEDVTIGMLTDDILV